MCLRWWLGASQAPRARRGARALARPLRILSLCAAGVLLFAGTAPAAAAAARSTPHTAPPARSGAPPRPALTAQQQIETVYALDMNGPRSGWMVANVKGEATVLHTANAGKNWAPAWTLGTAPALPQAVTLDFPTATEGWAALLTTSARTPTVTVARTSDGGTVWHAATLAAPGASAIHLAGTGTNDLVLLATGPATAGAMPETAFVSTDGGARWVRTACSCVKGQARRLPAQGLVTGLVGRAGGDAWVTELYHSGRAVPVYRSTDSGRVWRLQPLPIPSAYRRGFYVNAYPPTFWGPGAKDGVLVAQFVGIHDAALVPYTTSDGGARWTPALAVRFGAQAVTVGSAPGGRLWLLGRTGRPLLRSTDGGRRWSQVAIRQPLGTVVDTVQFDFLNGGTGWALVSGGGGWQLLRTTDGGKVWSLQTV